VASVEPVLRVESFASKHLYNSAILSGFPDFSCPNSASGTVNLEDPQFMQTTTFGNNKTPGLWMFLMPWKWRSSSAVNSALLN